MLLQSFHTSTALKLQNRIDLAKGAVLSEADIRVQRTIPNRLVFNYEVDLLKGGRRDNRHDQLLIQNMKNTMKLYSDMEVEFLDDAGCYEAIKATHSKALADHYTTESYGPYKSDICRLAQLAEKGGYYMDNDLVSIN